MKAFFESISMQDSVMAKFLECSKHCSKYGGKFDTIESFLCKWMEELHDGFLHNSVGLFFIADMASDFLQELCIDYTFFDVYNFVWQATEARLRADLVSWTEEYKDCEPKYHEEADECLNTCKQRIEEWNRFIR